MPCGKYFVAQNSKISAAASDLLEVHRRAGSAVGWLVEERLDKVRLAWQDPRTTEPIIGRADNCLGRRQSNNKLAAIDVPPCRVSCLDAGTFTHREKTTLPLVLKSSLPSLEVPLTAHVSILEALAVIVPIGALLSASRPSCCRLPAENWRTGPAARGQRTTTLVECCAHPQRL